MLNLSHMENTHGRKKRKRVGRGTGSGMGKTSGRGEKGAGSRSGYKRRLGYEGGQFRLFMKLPERGFSNVRFAKRLDTINLGQIDTLFEDGETVDEQSLRKRGFFNGKTYGIKLLGKGELTKKVTIEVDDISVGARDKLRKSKISFSLGKKKKEKETKKS